jgi:hypothetical protein
MHTDRCGDTSGQKYHAKDSRKQTKIQESTHRDTQRMWNMKCMIISVMTEANATVAKISNKYQKNIQKIHYKKKLHLEHRT